MIEILIPLVDRVCIAVEVCSFNKHVLNQGLVDIGIVCGVAAIGCAVAVVVHIVLKHEEKNGS